MSKHKAIAFEKPEEFSDPIHDLIRSGARQLTQSAIEAELQSMLETYQDEQTANGHQAVVRNGYLPERELQTGIGPVPVRVPKVCSHTGDMPTIA